jgi:pimeloyl-ACP methyl ester carboxylesterase
MSGKSDIGREAATEGEGFVRLAGGRVHYELAGPPRGAPVVLVPGFSVPYSTWNHNFYALAEAGFRVLRYDHFGRGLSDKPRLPYGWELFDSQLDALITALCPGPNVSLVGLSMGGAVTLQFAARHRGRIGRIALVDPLCANFPDSPLYRTLRLPLIGDAIMAVAGRWILSRGQAGDFYSPESYAQFLPSYRAQARRPGFSRAVLSTLRGLGAWPTLAACETVGLQGLPVLLVWGGHDATLPIASSAEILKRIANAEFRIVEGAGHVPHFERPDEVNALLATFLNDAR